MGDVKKWTVTYTKHVKQKRKVYQDGFLHIHSSIRKVMLYDECETLLASRLMKTDDIFRSGETLTFDTYLVDIGDTHGDHKPASNLHFQGLDKKINEKARSLHGRIFKTNSSSIEDRMTISGIKKASSINLSPSKKIIREFKIKEISKYSTSPSRPGTTKTSITEWQVLYTTQITQKAKKFHDGILKVANNGLQRTQIMLYDSTMRLLDNRFLKKDEIVSSGESLAFDGHLVEVGECEGDHKPPVDSNVQGRNCNVVGKTGIPNGQEVQTQNKCHVEFKKSEISKYSASPNRRDTTKTSTTEWQVLYTTQITQKAKKYHDGILKVAMNRLQGMQVMLYDSTRRLLDIRFLKKDEIVRSGESLTFDGHLVEVGECEGDHKPPADSNVQGRDCNVVGKTGKPPGQQVQTHNNCPVEWEAMYTTQVTQKAKKYHSGILRLASRGSYRMQFILLTEDGTVLSRKYLELSKEISTGSTFELPNYLVEVGEPRKHPKGEPQNGAPFWKDKEAKVRSSGIDNIILSRIATAKKLSCDGEPQSNASAWEDRYPNIRSSDAENIRSSRRVPANKPLRDAQGILSILKKPVTESGTATIKIEAVECDASYSDIQEEPAQDSFSGRSERENFDGKSNTMHHCGDRILRSEAVHNGLLVEPANSADSDKRRDSQPVIHTSSSFSFGSEVPNISRPSFDEESPIVVPQVLDALNLESDGPELMLSKATSSLSSRQSSEEVKPGKKSQPCADNTGIGATSRGAFGFGIATSKDTSNDPCNVEEKNPEVHISKKTTDEFPSFDLGF